MLNIILYYHKNNTYNDIYNYIKHINNINVNVQLEILITILNTDYNNLLNENVFNTIAINNINILTYNYQTQYYDLLYNEIIKNSPYDLILFSEFNIYLSEIILEYILLNEINNNIFIRTNIIELETLSNIFLENYNSDKLFTNILDNLKYINNENFKQPITKSTYVTAFNNNTLVNISSKDIIANELYYLNNSSEFLLIHKSLLLKYGFNTTNTNYENTFQYVILNLINNNISMTKLPVILSAHKLITNKESNIINYASSFTCTTNFDTNINYKLYNYKLNKQSSFIRSHIRILNGIHNNDLKTNYKNLKKDNTDLLNENTFLKNTIKELEIINENLNKSILELNKNNELLINNYNKISEKLNLYKNTYINKLKIINSNINEIIINEKNNLLEID